MVIWTRGKIEEMERGVQKLGLSEKDMESLFRCVFDSRDKDYSEVFEYLQKPLPRKIATEFYEKQRGIDIENLDGESAKLRLEEAWRFTPTSKNLVDYFEKLGIKAGEARETIIELCVRYQIITRLHDKNSVVYFALGNSPRAQFAGNPLIFEGYEFLKQKYPELLDPSKPLPSGASEFRIK